MPNKQDNQGPKQGGQTSGKPGTDREDDRRPQSTPGQGKKDQGREPATDTENDEQV